jgi:hypothetical protein
MRCIALLSLICLVGGASAQAMFTGEGYGSSQLAYFNGPNTTPFEPFVEKYWDSYIHNAPNLTGPTYNPATSMNIWFNLPSELRRARTAKEFDSHNWSLFGKQIQSR